MKNEPKKTMPAINQVFSSIYISRADSIDKKCRNRMIIDEFNNGATYKELAIKYGLTVVWVRNIVDGKI